MEIIQVDQTNIDNEHICCAIGNDKVNRSRAQLKKDWLKQRFNEGHVFKKFNVRGKVFVEYVPAEFAWAPVEAPGYIFMHCLWVSGRYKGQGLGKKLVEECISNSCDKNGIAVIVTKNKKPFMTDKKFFLQMGFEVCDEAPPYFELLVKKNKKAPLPKFRDCARKANNGENEGMTFYYSDQCPFTGDFVDIMMDVARKYGINSHKIKFETTEQAQNAPSPFTIFSLFYKGEFLTFELMTASGFEKFLKKTLNL